MQGKYIRLDMSLEETKNIIVFIVKRPLKNFELAFLTQETNGVIYIYTHTHACIYIHIYVYVYIYVTYIIL